MKRRLNYYRFCLRIADYSLPALAFAATVYVEAFLKIGSSTAGLGTYSFFSLFLQTSLVWAVASEYYGVSSVQELFRERTGIRAAFAACTTTYAATLGVLFFFHEYTTISRAFLLLSGLNLLVAALAMRALFRSLVSRHSGPLWKPDRILIIGADQFARRCARRLIHGPLSFCRIVGHIYLPGTDILVENAPVYPLSQVEELCRDGNVDEILVAVPSSKYSEVPRLVRDLERLALPVRAILDFGDHMMVRERLFQFGRLQILDLTATPAESLKYALLKRCFDIVFAIFALLVTAPIMALVATAIRLTSAGPVLFVQERVGLNGKTFRMYKFRTMRVSPRTESDIQWTTANDPRRTPIGSFLRRTSLDELPQFFNVLKGDMSVVGPRPERPGFVKKFLTEVSRYNYRHRLKVGITGWAQVNGWRGDTSIRRRVEHDLYYLQNWNFFFDVRIIFLTLFSRYRNRNAY
ncbi:MAG: undecaprenyl-phosphate glucose phosphotransferase [Candidatus Acidiferrales bacterium]